jgi:hypothetical protein
MCRLASVACEDQGGAGGYKRDARGEGGWQASLARFGQLSATEVFEHFGDAAAGPELIQLLGSEHETVREWSALRLRSSVFAGSPGSVGAVHSLPGFEAVSGE